MSRELLQQALEQLKRTRWASNCEAGYSNDPVIAALEAELAKPEQEPFKPDWVNYRQGLADGAAQPEQEPVCDKDPSLCGFVQCQLGKACKNTPINTMPTKIFGPNLEQILNAAGFYKRDWVGLTDDEMFDAMDSYSELENGRKIEQLLKEKNT